MNILNSLLNKSVIVRSVDAGVFFGTLVESTEDGKAVRLKEARKLWYWDGAAAVEGLAAKGVTKPGNCKFTATIDEIGIMGVCQVLPATDDAAKSIKAVKNWEA